MTRFLISYTDPETGEDKERVAEFEDTPTCTAREWAEDAAYMWADKGPYTIRDLK